MLCTAAFTQSSLYPHMLLHREVCAQRNFTHRRIYTEVLRKEALTLRSALFGRTCTVAVWTLVHLFASSSWSATFRVPLPKSAVSFPACSTTPVPEFIGLYKKQCVIPCYHTLAIPGIIHRICFPGSFFSATSCVLLLRPNILSMFLSTAAFSTIFWCS